MQLSLVGRGNTLNYIRIKSEQTSASSQTPAGSTDPVSHSGLIPYEWVSVSQSRNNGSPEPKFITLILQNGILGLREP